LGDVVGKGIAHAIPGLPSHDGAWPSEGMTRSVFGKGSHRGLPLRGVLVNQGTVRPANLAPMAKAFSQSAGNTVRWCSSLWGSRATSASATIVE